MKKDKGSYMVKPASKESPAEIIPLNRKARKAMAKKYGLKWSDAKEVKKNKPLHKTLTGLAPEEDIIEV